MTVCLTMTTDNSSLFHGTVSKLRKLFGVKCNKKTHVEYLRPSLIKLKRTGSWTDVEYATYFIQKRPHIYEGV